MNENKCTVNTDKNATTTIQSQQQQLRSKVVNEIIRILADNSFSITESRDVLGIVSRKLGKQIVTISS